MARAKVLYDISRLATRFSRLVPNGIDRVDIAYADYYLSADRTGAGGILLGPLGVRAVSQRAARAIVDTVSDHWLETGSAERDPAYQQVKAALIDRPERAAHRSSGFAGNRLRQSLAALLGTGTVFGREGFLPGSNPARAAPEGAIYLNVSQFPVWIDSYFRWLRRRPDVKPVFFIHDLLPIGLPEFFPPAEATRHAARLDVVSRYARGVIVASEDTRLQLRDHMRQLGRGMPACCVAPIPVDPSFLCPVEIDPELAGQVYFVAVGTLEPRKNYLLLLHVWRELAQTEAKVPKLVIVGTRGWEHENVADLLERCKVVRDNVIVVGELSTPGLLRLLASARALLMPSFAEGYGLPAAEALAAGIPVIASSVPSCRGYEGPGLTRLDPTDGLGWLGAIRSRFSGAPGAQRIEPSSSHGLDGSNRELRFRHIEEFLTEL